MRSITLAAVVAFLGVAVQAQDPEPPVVRVFVAESKAQAFNAAGWTAIGWSNDQTVEIQKNVHERRECSGLRVTNRASRAHFVISMDRSGGRFSKGAFGAFARDNKIAVFDGWGDLIFSTSTRSLGNAVKDGCQAIHREIESGAELITIGETDESQ